MIPQEKITTEAILREANKLLKTRSTVTPRDIWYKLARGSWTGFRGKPTATRRIVTLEKISKTLRRNGYVVIEKKSKGYSVYAKEETEVPTDDGSADRTD